MLKFKWNELSAKYKDDIMKLEDSYLENIYDGDNQIDFLIIKHNEHVIAYMSYKEHYAAYDIYNIVVNKVYRKQGIATNLFENLKGKNIFLEVSEKNEVAIKFYKKLGFIKLRELDNYYKDNLKAYCMVKEVDNK